MSSVEMMVASTEKTHAWARCLPTQILVAPISKCCGRRLPASSRISDSASEGTLSVPATRWSASLAFASTLRLGIKLHSATVVVASVVLDQQ